MISGPDVLRRGDPRRHFLLETCLAMVALAPERQPALLATCAGGLRVTACCHPEPLTERPSRAAVGVVHVLDVGVPAVHAWTGRWAAQVRAAEQLALAAALLLSQRDELLLLVVRRYVADDPGSHADEPEGFLVDAGTCERIAIAGLDAESELSHGSPRQALIAAGDLLHGLDMSSESGDGASHLVLGLKKS